MLPPPPNTNSPTAWPVGAGQGQIFQGISRTSEQSPFGCSKGVPWEAIALHGQDNQSMTAKHTYASGSIFGMSSTVNLAEACEISMGMFSIDI